MARTLVIANPRSRHGSTGRRWAGIEASLRRELGELDVRHTSGPRDAERIARSAAGSGVERIVIAGGDGTVSEVVTGVLGAGLGEYVELGLLPLGTGGDLARTMGVPSGIDEAVAALAAGGTRRVDAGRVTFRGRDEKEASSYFLNVASFGVSGLVDELVTRVPQSLGGTVAFALASIRAIVQYRFGDVSIRIDGEPIYDGPVALAAAGNGRYFGGGMKVAPEARPDDGELDFVLVRAMSRLRLLANFPKLYAGTHVQHAVASAHRGRRIEVDGVPGEIWLDIDGEPLGTLPALIEVVPAALTLFGVPAAETD